MVHIPPSGASQPHKPESDKTQLSGPNKVIAAVLSVLKSAFDHLPKS